MKLKRLEISAEFEDSTINVFHTPYEIFIDDPPTIIVIDGREYLGRVTFKQKGETFEIIITPIKRDT